MKPGESDEVLTLTHATERDVDLLLVEELKTSEKFLEQFLNLMCLPSTQILSWSVTHSRRRTYSRREIDIAVSVERTVAPRRLWLLVENKLDETEQPEQAESYAQESATMLREARADLVRTVLVCPDSYAQKNADFAAKFDHVVQYERVAEILAKRTDEETGELRARIGFRRELILQAITKARRGYQQIPLAPIATFNTRYVALCREIAPKLPPGPNMLRLDGNPAESVSMLFDHANAFSELPREIRPRRLAHEFGRGQVHRSHYAAVTIGAWGSHFEKLKPMIEKDLALVGYQARAALPTSKRPRPGLVIYAETPPIDNLGDFAMQRKAIERGIRETDELRHWVLSNAALLQKWKAAFDAFENPALSNQTRAS